MAKQPSKNNGYGKNIFPEEGYVQKSELVKLNYKWIIGTLLFFIITFITSLLTKKVYSGNELLRFIENFATILSVILSVSSILYAYFTSRDTEKQFSEISKAVDYINYTSNSMAEKNKEISGAVEKLTINVAELKLQVKNSAPQHNSYEVEDKTVEESIKKIAEKNLKQ